MEMTYKQMTDSFDNNKDIILDKLDMIVDLISKKRNITDNYEIYMYNSRNIYIYTNYFGILDRIRINGKLLEIDDSVMLHFEVHAALNDGRIKIV